MGFDPEKLGGIFGTAEIRSANQCDGLLSRILPDLPGILQGTGLAVFEIPKPLNNVACVNKTFVKEPHGVFEAIVQVDECRNRIGIDIN